MGHNGIELDDSLEKCEKDILYPLFFVVFHLALCYHRVPPRGRQRL